MGPGTPRHTIQATMVPGCQTSRSKLDLSNRRRTGADSIPSWPRLGPDHRTLPRLHPADFLGGERQDRNRASALNRYLRSDGELEQIQFLLGHVSVQTTERYLGCTQRISSAVNDRIGIEPAP